MAAVKPIPDGYPQVSAYLIVDGAAAAIDFYATVLGTTERIMGYKVRKYSIDPGRFRAGQTAVPVTRWRSVGR